MDDGHTIDAGTASSGSGGAVSGSDAGGGGGGRSAPGNVGGAVADVIQLRRVLLPSAPASDAAALISMIERAASNPDVDVDRMERLYAMYERAQARSARSAYLDALMRAKAQLPRVIKAGSASYEDKKSGELKKAFSYAKWEDVCSQIEPVLAEHGLVLTFASEQAGSDRVAITGILSHRDGHSERAQMALGCDASGGKNNAQGWGSAISYGKRYTAFALLNLVGHDDKDNDGAGATIDDEQQAELMRRITALNVNIEGFLEYIGAPSISDMPATKYAQAIAALDKKAKAK